ncbi:endoplasmic reticulum retention protein [Dimargaris cristalligena]|uniref:ER lumen protein-retaining receptor n=1 Tax=Dimargaris cristalligena TaxID=215637 RepID=A0A4P9ZQY6_9FUNG|nr:endoplasmic reticulum retention protein [Dimargaris cristalligena]RKP35914.1 ER lumen protein retaining receptor-domain-containing protein [Dimargaris cristalligena]|eukprot:RKP35914.1 ER lumen protein retaining receptor-domain-containing protein [Dimargaris cristalligena]
MNIFRLVADLLHLASIFILLLKIQQTKSCAGVSLKTQALYFVVFVTRYLDLFTHFYSVYNSLMKLFFIASSAYIVYLMWKPYRPTYSASTDTFRAEFLIVGAALLGLAFPDSWHILDILWSFSIYLEAVAILPQLFQMTRTGEAETITSHYVFALGAYRALYLMNWIYRYYTEGYMDVIAWVAGAVQTILYADFFYIYLTRVMRGRLFSLPV